MRTAIYLILTGIVWIGQVAPAAAGVSSPLDFLEVLDGPAKVQAQGTWVLVTFGSQDADHERIFRVDTIDLKGSVELDVAASKILSWDGSLILLDQQKSRAWHFSVPGADERNKGLAGVRPDSEGLKALLADYDLTRVSAQEISSHSWPKGFRPERARVPVSLPLTLEPGKGSPRGVEAAACGTRCSINCRNGVTCQTSCSQNRCSSCSCAALCACF